MSGNDLLRMLSRGISHIISKKEKVDVWRSLMKIWLSWSLFSVKRHIIGRLASQKEFEAV